MTGWAGATAQQASADETGAVLAGTPWPNCEKSVGQQLLQKSNAQATLGRSPPSRLAQITRIAVYRRITTRTCSLAPDNPATRRLICRGAVCALPVVWGSRSQNEALPLTRPAITRPKTSRSLDFPKIRPRRSESPRSPASSWRTTSFGGAVGLRLTRRCVWRATSARMRGPGSICRRYMTCALPRERMQAGSTGKLHPSRAPLPEAQSA